MRAPISRIVWRSCPRTVLALAAIGLSTVLVFNGALHAYSDWTVSTITGPMLGDEQGSRTKRMRRTLLNEQTLGDDHLSLDEVQVSATAS